VVGLVGGALLKLRRAAVEARSPEAPAVAPRPRDDELRELADRLVEAEAELVAAEESVKAAGESEAELAELDADEYLGTIEPSEYERRRAEVEQRAFEARKDRDRKARIVAALRGRAADLAQAIARDRVTEARQQLENEERVVAEAMATMRRAERDRAEAEQVLARAERALSEARVPFDPRAARNASERRSQELEQVRWAARHGRDDDVPAHLREAVAEERARLQRVADEENLRTRERARASWAQFGGSPFPD
jgi:hypothetical protein